MTTIKDVAHRAGVALGTASRVLSGAPHTSPEARAKVMQAARELDYVAHGPARALRRAKTDVLGLIVSDIRNPFFSELAHAAEVEASTRGYAVLLANADENAEREAAHLHTFASQRIDGLLIAPQTISPSAYLPLVRAEFPLVFVDRRVPGLESVPAVTGDNAGGVRLAMDWLRGRGRRRVAFIGGPTDITSASERRDTFVGGRSARGFDEDAGLLGIGDFQMGSGADAIRRVLDAGHRPDGILVADGLMTLGVLRELAVRHIDTRAIDIVSFDDAPWFDLLETPVSSVMNDATEMGRRAMQSLLALLGGESVPSSVVPTRLIDRSENPS